MTLPAFVSPFFASGGKVTYVEPNQLTLPDEYPDVRHFPDRGVMVDGFLLCVDASIPFTPSSQQHDVFTRLTMSLMVKNTFFSPSFPPFTALVITVSI